MKEEEILTRKLKALFPDKQSHIDAVSILSEYGRESYEPEKIRVRLAIVKLASNSLDKIIEYTYVAKQDYRDILSWAEYPRQSEHWSLKNKDKKQQLIKEDLEEYQQWLNT